VKLAIIIGLMQFRMHEAYITSVTDMTTYDTHSFVLYTGIKRTHSDDKLFYIYINKTQLLHSTMQD